MAPVIKNYFKYSQSYSKEYGEKTIVLMQVGAFFEMYGLQDKHNPTMYIGTQIEDICKVCDLSITLKSKVTISIENANENYMNKTTFNVGMAGFRDYNLEKYIQKIIEYGYTCIVYVQDPIDPSAERQLAGIFSIGTYFSNEEKVEEEHSNSNLTNHILCIRIQKTYFHSKSHTFNFLEKFKYSSKNNVVNHSLQNTLIIGLSSIDILTGYSNYVEFNKEYLKGPSTFDEVDKFISIYRPNETIVLYDEDEYSIDEIKKMVHFMNIQSKIVRYVHLNAKVETNNSFETNIQKIATFSNSQKNQNDILKKYLYNNEYELFNESQLFSSFECAKQSFCFLLEFLTLHNIDLIKHIQEPELYQEHNTMVLGNHTLKQLNIIDDGNMKGVYSSVSSLLNICNTPMGKRYFNHVLMNPITDVDFLNSQYALIDHIKTYYKKDIHSQDSSFNYESLYMKMKQICDLEKKFKKCSLNKITPFEIYKVYESLVQLNEIYTAIHTDSKCMELSKTHSKIHLNIEKNIKHCSLFVDNFKRYLNIQFLGQKQNEANQYSCNFFNSGIHSDLDEVEKQYVESYDILLAIQEILSGIIKDGETKPKSDTTYCKLHETEKSGFCFKTTSTRYKKLEQILSKNKSKKKTYTHSIISSYDSKEFTFELDATHITKIAKGKDIQIYSKQIQDVCSIYSNHETKFKQLIKEKFNLFVETIVENSDEMFELVKSVVDLDIYMTKACLAIKYNYCKPEIQVDYSNEEECFIEAKQIRHALIEHLQTDELYVANDIVFNKDTDLGILLYGTNAVGKSSFIKSIGICLIMAQSGFFVPCSAFTYVPYTQLFTRILGNDNIFKGLSTFAVEMSELRTILKYSNSKTLVLGDELCSGTEQGSAISIFLSGLKTLYDTKCNFIFATHMHEIVELEYIKEREKIHLKHMSVHYDIEKDCLVYDRILKDGSGSNNYGLEVCKSLQLPNAFLDEALRLRNVLFSNETNMTHMKKSRYNANKKFDICEICKVKPSCDIHHLQYQKYADENGFIGGFHKNHLANLSSICEDCHTKIHSKDTQFKRKKTSKGYVLESMS